MVLGWDGKWFFRTQGIYCLVGEDVGEGEQRGNWDQETRGLEMGKKWREGRQEGRGGQRTRKRGKVREGGKEWEDRWEWGKRQRWDKGNRGRQGKHRGMLMVEKDRRIKKRQSIWKEEERLGGDLKIKTGPGHSHCILWGGKTLQSDKILHHHHF